MAIAGAVQIATGILSLAGFTEKNWNFVGLCVLGFLGGAAFRAWLVSTAERREREAAQHEALLARIAGLESELKKLRTAAPTMQDQPFDPADFRR